MRIGNWLGGSVIWALAATMSMAASAGTAEHVTTVPLGGSLDGQSGDHHYGVYVPTRFGGELKVTTTDGQVVDLKGPKGTPKVNGQDIGFDQQGWYTFKVAGAKKPYTVADELRPGRPEHEEALELLLLADQGRLDPRAVGRRQCPRRHDDAELGRRSDDRHAGGLHRRPGSISSWPGRTGCSRRCRLPATTRPGSPTFMTTWTGSAPTRSTAVRSRGSRPHRRC